MWYLALISTHSLTHTVTYSLTRLLNNVQPLIQISNDTYIISLTSVAPVVVEVATLSANVLVERSHASSECA
jgi:hypothetical protein